MSRTSRKQPGIASPALSIDPGGQLVLVDTPGLHNRRDHALNRHLNRVAAEALRGVDLAVLVIDASGPTEEDEAAARAVAQAGVACVLVFNKIDRVKRRSDLLPLAETWSDRVKPVEVYFISALKGDGVDALADGLVTHLPEQPPLFPPDEFTTESTRFLAAEIVREQLWKTSTRKCPTARRWSSSRSKRSREGTESAP